MYKKCYISFLISFFKAKPTTSINGMHDDTVNNANEVYIYSGDVESLLLMIMLQNPITTAASMAAVMKLCNNCLNGRRTKRIAM